MAPTPKNLLNLGKLIAKAKELPDRDQEYLIDALREDMAERAVRDAEPSIEN